MSGSVDITALPNEVIYQVLSYFDDPIDPDLINIGQTSKLFYELTRPLLYKSITLIIPGFSGDWEVDQAFCQVTDGWKKHLREIEIVNFRTIDQKDKNLKHVPRPVLIREKGKPSTPDVFCRGQIDFNQSLSNLISGLKPGQLHTFKFLEHGYRGRYFGYDVGTPSLKALISPPTVLTRLEITFDPCVEHECTNMQFPYLKYLRYGCYNEATRHHLIFSLLHSCQDTLEELYSVNSNSPGGIWLTNEYNSIPKITTGFNLWKACKNCCQQDKDRRIQFKHLKSWTCSGSFVVIANVFMTNNVLAIAQLESLRLGNELELEAAGSDLNIARLLFYSTESLIGPRIKMQFDDYFRHAKGLTVVKFSYASGDDLESEWLSGLKECHGDSLRELSVTITENDGIKSILRDLGTSFRNLEALTVKKGNGMPICIDIFNKQCFPRLKRFRDISTLREGDKPWKEAVQKGILENARNGTFSLTINEIRVGALDYTLTIRRGDKPNEGHQSAARLEGAEESIPKIELDELLGELGIVLEETGNALGTFPPFSRRFRTALHYGRVKAVPLQN